MVSIELSETTTKNWPRVLRILKKNKDYIEEAPITHTTKYDLTNFDNLTALRKLLKLISGWEEDEQKNVIIVSDGHLISNHQHFTNLLECYSNSLDSDDPDSYCCQVNVRLPDEDWNEDNWCSFNPCRQLDERIFC